MIDDRIDKMMNDGEVHICYALHDMDCDDIPELIMLYGESPGTQLIDIYSYSNGYIIPALKELSGKYMHFGKNKNKLVLIYGRLLDRVSLIFYEMDNQKNVKEIDSYNNLEYDSQDIESFNSILREYGVSLLSRSEVWTSSGEFHSALVNGETRNSYTFDGLSYELLENYDF